MTANNRKIHEALHNARLIVRKKGVGKNQTNQAQNYKYRAANDVITVVDEAFAEVGIIVIPRLINAEFETFTSEYTDKWNNPKLKITRFCKVDMEYDVVCKADGSSVLTKSSGEGFDMSDKAMNKARTAALKYMFTEMLLIPEQGIDSEVDHIEIEQDAPAKVAKVAQEVKPAQTEDVSAWAKKIQAAETKAGLDQVLAGLREAYNSFSDSEKAAINNHVKARKESLS